MGKKDIQDTIFFFLFLSLLSLLIFYSSQFSLVKNLRGYFERPVLSLERGIYGLKERIFSRQDYQEKTSLEAEIRYFSVKAGGLSVCLEENEAMRHLLDAPLPPSWHFIPAKVIGFYQRLKINVGERAGVKEGMLIVSQNLLVGRVVSVEKYSSLVLLITDPSLRIPAIVRSPGEKGIRARGILSGYLDQKLTLSEILKSERVKKNDLVFTSGEGEWLPDLLIGKVEEIEEGKEKVFQKAVVSALVDYKNLRYVFVIRVF